MQMESKSTICLVELSFNTRSAETSSSDKMFVWFLYVRTIARSFSSEFGRMSYKSKNVVSCRFSFKD